MDGTSSRIKSSAFFADYFQRASETIKSATEREVDSSSYSGDVTGPAQLDTTDDAATELGGATKPSTGREERA